MLGTKESVSLLSQLKKIVMQTYLILNGNFFNVHNYSLLLI